MGTSITNLRFFTASDTQFGPKVVPVDLKVTGSTKIFDLAFGGTYKVPAIGIRVDVVDADTVTAPAVISVGTNSPNYDDLVKSLSIDGILDSSNLVELPIVKMIPNTADVFAKVIVPGSGVSFKAAIFVAMAEYQLV